jgi:hypothetical protein
MTTAFYDGKDPLTLKCGEVGHVLIRVEPIAVNVDITALVQSGAVTTDLPKKTDAGGNVIFDVNCPSEAGGCPTVSSILFYPSAGGKGVSVEVRCVKPTTSTTISAAGSQRLVYIVDDVKQKLAYLQGQLDFG